MDEKRLRELAGLEETFVDPFAVKALEKTLQQMEKFTKSVARDEARQDDQGTFLEGYEAAIEVWLKLLAKEFPGLRNKVK